MYPNRLRIRKGALQKSIAHSHSCFKQGRWRKSVLEVTDFVFLNSFFKSPAMTGHVINTGDHFWEGHKATRLSLLPRTLGRLS